MLIIKSFNYVIIVQNRYRKEKSVEFQFFNLYYTDLINL